MYAIDVSNFSGKITDEQAKLFRDSNRKIIVGCQDPAVAIHNVQTAARHCLEVELYAQLYASVPLDRELAKASEVAAVMPAMPRLWLAFEDDLPAGLSHDFAIGWIDRALLLAEKEYSWTQEELGVYTRREWWVKHTGGTSEFSHYPLWDAYYDDTGVLDANYEPYGWDKRTMKQYDDNFILWGMRVDLNVY